MLEAVKSMLNVAGEKPERKSPDFVEAAARAIGVLECYGDPHAVRQRGRLTLTEVAKLTGLSRGTARRLLLTLRELHYLDSDGKYFWLTPKILGVSNAFMMPLGLGDESAAILSDLTRELGESASVGLLEAENIVYIERVEVRRIYSSRIVNGTRLPAASSSIGRVLLAQLSDEALSHWLASYGLQKLTPKTIVNRSDFLMEIDKVRRAGYALIDEELEIGIRSISVPIVGGAGRVIAALNSSTSTARHEVKDLVDEFLPKLRRAAERLSETMNW